MPEVIKLYSMQWRREILDLAELATKRYLEGWQLRDLAIHFGRPEDSVQWAYIMLKRKAFEHKQIPPDLKKKLLKTVLKTAKGVKNA